MMKFDEVGIANGKKRNLGELMIGVGLVIASLGYLKTQCSQRFAKIEVVQAMLKKDLNQKK